MTPETFKAARDTLRLTQTQLADLWGMGKNGERTIRRWEQGAVPVNPIAAYCISMMLPVIAAPTPKEADHG
jgi:DNA-binding transcriptional regulator YiaG